MPNPNIAKLGEKTRFPVNRQEHTQKHPGGYLTPILKKLLNKQMKVTDPEVKRVLEIKSGTKAELKKIIMLRYILNAIEGETQSIEGILDRVDGKLGTNNNHKGAPSAIIINIRNQSGLLTKAETGLISHQRK